MIFEKSEAKNNYSGDDSQSIKILITSLKRQEICVNSPHEVVELSSETPLRILFQITRCIQKSMRMKNI